MQKKEVIAQKKIWVLEKLGHIVAPTGELMRGNLSVTTRISSMN